MTGTSPALSSDTLGRVLHEARRAVTDGRDRPWPVEEWADRDLRLQAIDEKMAAAVEAEVRRRIAADFRRLSGDLERFTDFPPGVPRVERQAKLEAWLAAVQVALYGLALQEHGDGKESQP